MKNYEMLRAMNADDRLKFMAEHGIPERDARTLAPFVDIFPLCDGLCFWRGVNAPSECKEYKDGKCLMSKGIYRWLMSESEGLGNQLIPVFNTKTMSALCEKAMLRYVGKPPFPR